MNWVLPFKVLGGEEGVSGDSFIPGPGEEQGMDRDVPGWFQHWYRTAWRIVRHPTRFFEEEDPTEDYWYAAQFASTSGAIAAVLYLFLTIALTRPVISVVGLDQGTTILAILVGVILGYLWLAFGTIGFSIIGVLIHVTLQLLGVEGELHTTKDVTAYASAVAGFLGWFPILSILAVPYLFYVQIRGVEAFHDVPFGTAFIAVLLPVVVLSLGAVGLLVAAALISVAGS